jgi:hypothetical protein
VRGVEFISLGVNFSSIPGINFCPELLCVLERLEDVALYSLCCTEWHRESEIGLQGYFRLGRNLGTEGEAAERQ